MSTSKDLFSPLALGPLTLPNRMVMAPMTRSRAGEGDAPTEMTVTYYAQRATAGLLISEATQISPQGKGYPLTPGIFTEAQVAAWQRVTDAVHARAGRIFVQLWHVGRVAMQAMQPGHALPVGPSAIRPAGKHFTGEEFVTPRALEASELPGVVQQYADAARQAHRAGFDGVEIHAGNGYLLDQFLRDGSNRRTDLYGGSVENRCRLLLEVTEAVAGVWGKARVGVRVTPTGTLNDMRDSDPGATFGHAARRLGELGIGYLHVAEPVARNHPMASRDQAPVAPRLRAAFQGVFMLNGGLDKDTGNAAIASGAADLVSFGVPFLANPDLVRRYAEDRPLNAPDPSTMYGGGAAGYIDYPSLDEGLSP